MSTNPFRRSSFKEANNAANKSVPEPDGTSTVPLSVDTRGMCLCSGHLASTRLTITLCSPQLGSETRQLCISSRHSYISSLIPVFARIDAEFTYIQPSPPWDNNPDRLQPGYTGRSVPRRASQRGGRWSNRRGFTERKSE